MWGLLKLFKIEKGKAMSDDLGVIDLEVEEDEMVLCDDGVIVNNQEKEGWKILIVDDDKDMHSVTKLVLRDVEFEGRGFEFLYAYSGEQACKIMREYTDIAIILLDVVMESDDAGLRVVRYVRETLKNDIVRIILQTGQPGYAPELSVIIKWEINDYIEKAMRTSVRLTSAIITSLRAYFLLKQYRDVKDSLELTVLERTKGLKQANRLLEHLAYYDGLTNLPNRMLFVDRIKQAIESGRRGMFKDNTGLCKSNNALEGCSVERKRCKKFTALLMVDLDRFKDVNDTKGHAVGDELLKQVAARLLNCVRKTDTVARMGGDEFAVILTNISTVDEVAMIARKIVGNMSDVFVIGDVECFIGASVGISLCPCDAQDADILMQKADRALYVVKDKLGRGGYYFYDSEMEELVNKHNKLRVDLEIAIREDQFILVFQPRQCLKTKRIEGVEVFVEWEHPEYGRMQSSEFVFIAENFGLISDLGQLIFRKICDQVFKWSEDGYDIPGVIHNVTLRELRQPGFVSGVRQGISRLNGKGKLMEIEVPERSVVSDSCVVFSVVDELRGMGIGSAIDRCEGELNLRHLREAQVDRVCIDAELIGLIGEDSEQEDVIRAIIAMARKMQMSTVALGVVTKAQVDFLRRAKCDIIQGDYVSRPLPVDLVVKTFRK